MKTFSKCAEEEKIMASKSFKQLACINYKRNRQMDLTREVNGYEDNIHRVENMFKQS